jgi:hypothetical protein
MSSPRRDAEGDRARQPHAEPGDPLDVRPGDHVTAEVGSEGGSPGDLELHRRRVPGKGSEASELWESGTVERDVARDETGEGRRSPTGDH